MVAFSLVRFEIPVHDTIVVKVLQGQDCFSKVQPCHFYRQGAHVLEQVGAISTFMTQKTISIVFIFISAVWTNYFLFQVLHYRCSRLDGAKCLNHKHRSQQSLSTLPSTYSMTMQR